MVDNITHRPLAASAWTRVAALVPQTSHVPRTFIIDDAFRSAAFVWIARVFSQASTDALPRALGVGAAR